MDSLALPALSDRSLLVEHCVLPLEPALDMQNVKPHTGAGLDGYPRQQNRRIHRIHTRKFKLMALAHQSCLVKSLRRYGFQECEPLLLSWCQVNEFLCPLKTLFEDQSGTFWLHLCSCM